MTRGTVVSITGSGFTGTAEVRFGEKPETVLNVLNDKSHGHRTANSFRDCCHFHHNPAGVIRSGNPALFREYD